MPAVTVIIPIYNSAAYLEKCLGSIRAQTLKDIQVICVDDGSTDGSIEILRRFAGVDDRFVVLEQKNAGAGVARNLGLEHATGEYLSFLDSDDVFEPDMLERLFTLAKERDLDVVVCRCDKFDDRTHEREPFTESLKAQFIPKRRAFSPSDVTSDFFESLVWWPWDKLFKREHVERTGLCFMPLRTTNDLYFVAGNVLLAERIGYTDDVLVHQRVRSASLSATRKRSLDNFYRALLKLRDLLIERGVYEQFRQPFLNYCATFSLWQLDTLDDVEAYLSLCQKLPGMFEELGVNNLADEEFYRDDVRYRINEIRLWSEVYVSVIVQIDEGDVDVRSCLDSLLDQSLKKIEVVCVASKPDGVAASTVREVSKRDSRVRLLCEESVKKILEQLRGEYVAVLCSADVMVPHALLSLSRLARDCGAQVAIADHLERWVDKRDAVVRRVHCRDVHCNVLLSDDERARASSAKHLVWGGISQRSFLLDAIDVRMRPLDIESLVETVETANRIVVSDDTYVIRSGDCRQLASRVSNQKNDGNQHDCPLALSVIVDCIAGDCNLPVIPRELSDDGVEVIYARTVGELNDAVLSSRGDWLLFLNHRQALAWDVDNRLLDRLTASEADVIIARKNVHKLQDDGRVAIDAADPDFGDASVESLISPSVESTRILQVSDSHVWGKAFRRSFVRRQHLEFSWFQRGYDFGFLVGALLRAGGIESLADVVIDEVGAGSRYGADTYDSVTDVVAPWVGILRGLEKEGLYTSNEETIVNAVADDMANVLSVTSDAALRSALCDELVHGDLARYRIAQRQPMFYANWHTACCMRGAVLAQDSKRTLGDAYEWFKEFLRQDGAAGSLERAVLSLARIPEEDRYAFWGLPAREQHLFERLVYQRVEGDRRLADLVRQHDTELVRCLRLEDKLRARDEELRKRSEELARTKARLSKVRKQLSDVRSSKAFKLGRVLTWPLRKTRDLRRQGRRDDA